MLLKAQSDIMDQTKGLSMSFQAMNKTELHEVIEQVGGVEVEKDATKAELLLSLQEAGITYGAYRKLYDPETAEEREEAAAQHEANKKLLVKMTRKNPTFEFRGYRFTKVNPFEVMTEEDFQDLLDFYDGFHLATPAEAKSFYS